MKSMNMNGIYASDYSAGLPRASNQRETQQTVYEKDQILEGIITKVSDEISINFEGKELDFPKDAVQDAREGEVRKFQVMEVSKNSIVLKEVGNSASQKTSGVMICTRVENGNAFSEGILQAQEAAAASEKEPAQSSQITGEDYEAIEEEGVLPEKLLLERLEQMVARVKEQRLNKAENLAAQKEQLTQKTEQIRKTAEVSSAEAGLEKRIAEQLAAANLPVTEENIERVAAAVRQSGEASKLNDPAAGYLLKNQLAPTIENVYKAVHSRERNPRTEFPETVFEELKDSIIKNLEGEGMEAGEEELKAARWLLSRELPVTAEQISRYQELMQVKDSTTQESAIELAVWALREGNAPEQADLSGIRDREIEKSIDDFSKISEKELKYAAAKHIWKKQTQTEEKQQDSSKEIELTLKELKKAAAEIASGAATEEAVKTFGVSPAEIDIQAVHARRQLEEIRLKLTVESGHKLLEKGIQIDTDGLNRIVEGLREIEQDYYKNLMREAERTPKDAEISLLRETTETIEGLKQAPAAVLGLTYARRSEITIGTLAGAAKESRISFEKAGEAYEVLGTSPRSDMGDSIQKAFQTVDAILEDLGLELTEANRRAVRILGHNQMELTRETIDDIKLYDAKLNQMFQNMQPSVTVEMIRQGENPLNMTVDEVNTVASEIKETLGITEEERFSSYLADLEQKKGITPEERESFIGIYRLLHQVSKSDSAVVGAVLKAGQELTLKNLLTAARTRNGSGIDAHMDASSGLSKTVSEISNAIDRQISAGIAEKKPVQEKASEETENHLESSSGTETKEAYGKYLAEQARENLTPGRLEAVTETAGSIEEMSLEAFTEALKQKEDPLQKQHCSDRAEEVRKLLKGSKAAIQFLRNYEIADSPEMIAAAKGLEESGGLADAVKTLDTENALDPLLASLESAEELQQEYQQFTERLDDTIHELLHSPDSTAEQRKGLLGLRGQVMLAGKLARQEYYEIPVQTSKGITNMNLKVIRNSGAGRVTVTMESGHGLLRAEGEVREGKLSCLITSESAAGLEQAKTQEDTLRSKLQETGIEVSQIHYSVDKSNITNYLKTTARPSEQTAGEKADTAMLYQTAKAFITCLGSQE